MCDCACHDHKKSIKMATMIDLLGNMPSGSFRSLLDGTWECGIEQQSQREACVSRVCVPCALISQSNKHHDKNTDGDS